MNPLEAAELEFAEAARASAAQTRCGARCDQASERTPYVLCRVHFRLQRAWRELERIRRELGIP